MSTQTPTIRETSERRWALLPVVVVLLMLGAGLLWQSTSFPEPRRNIRVGQVTAEIRSLENALSDFRAEFGDYPPSRLTLHTTKSGWDNDRRSKALIRRLWPAFDFQKPVYPDGFFAEGETEIRLDGPECLVFFLGGVRDTDGTYIGFSKNPAQPFTLSGGSRTTPFFAFRQDRLTDMDGDGNPEYLDPLSDQLMPYLYASGYDGKGYAVDDLDQDGDLTGTTTDKWMTQIYIEKSEAISFWNRESFQIISPGFDGQFGPGGVYEPETADDDLQGDRQAERDNITNFTSGRLTD